MVAGAMLAAEASRPVEVPMRTTPVDFAAEVLPILRANCAACHNDRKAEGRLVLESPQSILKGGEQGPAVVPGKGAESLLFKVAAHRQESFMPPADNAVGAKPLAPAELGLIQLWIDQGAAGSVAAHRDVRWQPLPGGYQPIFAVAVTPDGQHAVCTRGNRLDVYHLPSGSLETTLVDPALNVSANPSQAAAAHRDMVRALSFDPAGELLASGGFREVKLWRRPRVRCASEWTHEAPLVSAAVGGNGRLAATGDETGRIRIWETATGKSLITIAAHQAAVAGLSFSADSSVIYSISGDALLSTWKVADGAARGKPLDTASPIRALVSTDNWLVTGHDDGKARVWESKQLAGEAASEIKPLLEIQSHSGAVKALAASASQPGEFYSGGEDGLVRRWSAQSGKQLSELANGGPVVALAVRPDGRRVASAGANFVKLWDAEQSKQIVQLQDDPILTVQVAKIDSEIAFTKSAIGLAKQDIKSYEGPERRIMTTAEAIKKAEAEVVKAEKTRDEKEEAVEKAQGDEKKVQAAEKALQEAQTAVQVAGTVVERAKIVAERAVKNLADAQQGVSTNEELLKQHEAAKETAAAALKTNRPAVRSLAFSAGNDRLAVGCGDGAVHFYYADNGKPAQSHVEHTDAVVALAYTPSELLLTGSADRRVLMWSAPGAWTLERTIGQLERPELLSDRVLSVDFSHDGTRLATGGGVPSRSGELKIWNVADGNLVREITAAHTDTVFAVRFSPDGKHLASAAADRLIKLFDAETGQHVRTFAGHTAHVLGIGFSGDGGTLVSCGSDNVAKLWDASTGLPLRTYKGTMYQIGAYKREVTSVSFIGASEQILATCGDGTVRLHRTSSDGEFLVYTGAKGYQYAAAATPDGQTIIAGGNDGILRVWSGQERSPKQTLAPAR